MAQANYGCQVQGSKILMVGAGGIGCELLKTLVMTGFYNIELVLSSFYLTCTSVAMKIANIEHSYACSNLHRPDGI